MPESKGTNQESHPRVELTSQETAELMAHKELETSDWNREEMAAQEDALEDQEILRGEYPGSPENRPKG